MASRAGGRLRAPARDQLDPVGAPREARPAPVGSRRAARCLPRPELDDLPRPDPTPLLTGPGPARVTLFGHTRIGGRLAGPGRYLLRSHYMPFWKVSGACLPRARPERDDVARRDRRRPVLGSSPRRRRSGFVQAVDVGPRRLVPSGAPRPASHATPELEPIEIDSVTEALGSRLQGCGVPAHRVDLAVRATRQPAAGRRARARRRDGLRRSPATFRRCGFATPPPRSGRSSPSRPTCRELVGLVAGVLRSQVEQMLIDPRGNAFNPEPSGACVRRDFRDQSPWVFERKYELDSLCRPALARLAPLADDRVGGARRRPLLRGGAHDVALWRGEQEHDPESYVFRRRFATEARLPPRPGARQRRSPGRE